MLDLGDVIKESLSKTKAIQSCIGSRVQSILREKIEFQLSNQCPALQLRSLKSKYILLRSSSTAVEEPNTPPTADSEINEDGAFRKSCDDGDQDVGKEKAVLTSELCHSQTQQQQQQQQQAGMQQKKRKRKKRDQSSASSDKIGFCLTFFKDDIVTEEPQKKKKKEKDRSEQQESTSEQAQQDTTNMLQKSEQAAGSLGAWKVLPNTKWDSKRSGVVVDELLKRSTVSTWGGEKSEADMEAEREEKRRQKKTWREQYEEDMDRGKVMKKKKKEEKHTFSYNPFQRVQAERNIAKQGFKLQEYLSITQKKAPTWG